MPERHLAAATDFELRLLGGCEIVGPSGPIHLESTKTTALLAHVAVVGGAVPRRRLAALLWPDLAERRGAGNLRRALWDLRRRLNLPGRPPVLEADRDAVSLAGAARLRVDLDALRAALRAHPPDLVTAVDLYRGELLAGFRVDDAGPFEEWIAVERERLRAAFLEALGAAVERARAAGARPSALGWARRLAAADPWRESAHRQVMELLLLAGDPGAALAQYERCRRVLAEELQAEPSAATAALADSIRAGAREAPRGRAPGLPPPHGLPTFGTPFVGRAEELARLAARLDDPAVTVLTLVGPGGIGKTRLAAQAAWRAVDPAAGGDRRFPDGAWFVPPLRDRGPGALEGALAERFGLARAADDVRPLTDRLLDFVRDRRLLCIVDGAEHVIDEARALACRLASAPELVLMLTTRERLGIDAESVFELAGLAVPVARQGGDSASDAVRLLLQCARRARLGFEPDPEDLAAAAEICRRLEGSPLAIELAADWVRSLGLPDLARELAESLALLSARDEAPGRGLRTVFEASWERLADADRRALSRLAVFRGGMTRERAEAVSGCGLAVLARLVDRSLLRREPSGRYVLHEVLHECAEEKLAAMGTAADEARARHAAVFAQAAGGLAGADVAPIAAELDNLVAAWRWAVATGSEPTLALILDALVELAESAGRAEEAARLVALALTRPVAARQLAARLHLASARLANRLGDYPLAARAARRALGRGATALRARDRGRAAFELAESAYLAGRYREAAPLLDAALAAIGDRDPDGVLSVWSRKGSVALELGDLDAAQRAFERGRELARATEDGPALARFLAELGHVAYFRGELDLAASRFEEARARATAAGERATRASALQGLAFVAEERGSFAAALPLYRESLELNREAGDLRGVARTLMLIGENARLQGDLETARRLYEEALVVARRLGGGYLAGLLVGNLAYVAAALGDSAAALERVAQILRAYRDSGSLTVLLPALVALAQLCQHTGRTDVALTLLGAVAAHPANRRDHQLEINRVLARMRPALSAGELAAGLAAGRGRSPEALAAQAMAVLEVGAPGVTPPSPS
jgi:DNA-binding SARP family transcriptional activator/predicted ATPase